MKRKRKKDKMVMVDFSMTMVFENEKKEKIWDSWMLIPKDIIKDENLVIDTVISMIEEELKSGDYDIITDGGIQEVVEVIVEEVNHLMVDKVLTRY